MTAPVIRFLPYQRDWLQDSNRFKIGMFARQSGKTFTTCAEIVDDCIQHEIAGTRTRWVILSRGERQAKEAMESGLKPMIRAFYALYRGRLRDQGVVFQETDWAGQEANYKALEVVFPGGSRITALPANPDTARGFSANVMLDEFAFHQNSREIWKALFPVISAGFKLRVVSTPNGKGNKFYELITGGPGWAARGERVPQADGDKWSRHIVDIHAAVEQGLPRDLEEMRLTMADEDAWAQEFELQFLDELGAWLSYDLIASCEHVDAGKPELAGRGTFYFGNDIARRRDLWVLAIIEKVGDVFWLRELIEHRDIPFREMEDILAAKIRQYRPVRVGMDQTGMGEKPVEDAINRYGASRIEGVHLSGERRLSIASWAKQKFEDKTIRIPRGNRALRDDLHALERVASVSGGFRLVAGRNDNGHADRTWAIFLGLAMADQGFVPVEFNPGPERRSGDLHWCGALSGEPGRDDFLM